MDKLTKTVGGKFKNILTVLFEKSDELEKIGRFSRFAVSDKIMNMNEFHDCFDVWQNL